eukprot:6934462-Pyramimonas_sp.AAC.1
MSTHSVNTQRNNTTHWRRALRCVHARVLCVVRSAVYVRCAYAWCCVALRIQASGCGLALRACAGVAGGQRSAVYAVYTRGAVYLRCVYAWCG